jgi:site-specific DNA-methyltransferase (adenine-specific)
MGVSNLRYNTRLMILPLSSIDMGDRYRKDYSYIEDLIASIEENGLINPISVKETEDGRYLLLAGGRRYTAHMKAGWEKIKCHVYPVDLSEFDLRSIELDENLQREDLTFQESTALKKRKHELMVEMHKGKPGNEWSISDTAKLLGESRALVSEDIQLATAMEIHPEIAKAKNKSEAKRILAKIKENLVMEELKARANKSGYTRVNEQTAKKWVEYYNVINFFDWAKDKESLFSFIEVDPPYAIDLDKLKPTTTDDYNEVATTEYEEFIQNTIEACTRLAKKNAWIVFWHSFQWREMIVRELTKAGWNVNNQPLIWTKGAGSTNLPSKRLASDYEPALYASLGNAMLNKLGHGHVFNYKPIAPNAKIHPTERPLEMMKEIIDVFTHPNQSILVPFAGSGVTLRAALTMNRAARGCDLSQAYKDAYEINLYKDMEVI